MYGVKCTVTDMRGLLIDYVNIYWFGRLGIYKTADNGSCQLDLSELFGSAAGSEEVLIGWRGETYEPKAGQVRQAESAEHAECISCMPRCLACCMSHTRVVEEHAGWQCLQAGWNPVHTYLPACARSMSLPICLLQPPGCTMRTADYTCLC